MSLKCETVFLFALFMFARCQIWLSPASPLLPQANRRMAVGSYNQQIFILGGVDVTDELWTYSIQDDNFETIDMSAVLPNINLQAPLGQYYASLDNILYFLTRYDDINYLSIYDMATNTYTYSWLEIAEEVGGEACLTSTTEYLFVVGGGTGSASFDGKDIIQILVLSTNKWIMTLPSMNHGREDASCAVDPITNKLYAIAGDQDKITNEVIGIDNIESTSNTNTWTLIANLTDSMNQHRAVIYGHTVYIIGGYLWDTYKYTSSVHTINTITNAVTITYNELQYGVGSYASIIVDGIIYAFGGQMKLDELVILNNWQYYKIPPTTTTIDEPTVEPTTIQPSTIEPTTLEPTTSEPTTPEPTTALPTTSTAFNDTLPSPITSYCNDVTVEIINLDGITSWDFAKHDELKVFIANITKDAIARNAKNYGIDENEFDVGYKSSSDNINITLSLCVEKMNILNVLEDVITERSEIIAGFIKNDTIKYFEGFDQVQTDNLQSNIYWGSPGSAELKIPIMEVPSLYVTLLILGLFFLFGLISLLDAKCYRQNDYFMPTALMTASFEVSDTVLDVLFAVVLLLIYLQNDDIEVLIAWIAAFAFIIIPIGFSVYQLVKKAKKSWLKDDELSNWLKEYGRFLYFFSIITGSSYTAIQIVNCGAFKLNIFNMGLNKQQTIKFNTKRIIGMVCLENIPQIIIQMWYLVRFGIAFLPILSIIFSITSIILTVLTMYTQRKIIKNQEIMTIEFEVIGDEIIPNLSTQTNAIKIKIGVLLGMEAKLIEIQKPRIVPQGLRFEILCFIHHDRYKELNCKTTINTAIENRKLANIIKDEWKLQQLPSIGNVKFIPDDDDGYVGKEIECVETNKYNSIETDEDEFEDHDIGINVRSDGQMITDSK